MLAGLEAAPARLPARTRLPAEALLELRPLPLDGVLAQVGLAALQRVVPHVHLHQAQNLEDPPDRQNSVLMLPEGLRERGGADSRRSGQGALN